MEPSARGPVSWGARVAAVIPALVAVAGCGAPTAPATPVVAGDGGQKTASAEAPPGGPALGPPVRILDDQSNQTTCARTESRSVSVGPQSLTSTTITGVTRCGDTGNSELLPGVRAVECPLRTRSKLCAYLTSASVDGKRAPVMMHPERRWEGTLAGPGAVYLVSEKHLERFDASGDRVPFVTQEGLSFERSTTRLLDLGSRLVTVSYAPFSTIAGKGLRVTLNEFLPLAQGTPGASVMTEIYPAHSVAEARRWSGAGQAILAGDVFPVALQDDTTAGAWAMVWLEAIPPGRRITSSLGSRNGCGHPSRSLSDPSVDKKLHITRFQGVSQTSDKVVLRTRKFSIGSVEATPAGVEINGTTYDRQGKKTGAVRPTPAAPAVASVEQGELFWKTEQGQIPWSADEEPLGAEFDAASGQGVVLVRASERLFFRRFDAQGRLLGEAMLHPHRPPRGPVRLARAGARWLVLDPASETIAVLGGAIGSTPVQTGGVVDFASGPGHARLIKRQDGQLIAVDIDHDANVAGAWAPARQGEAARKPTPGPPEGCLLELSTGPSAWVQVCWQVPEPFRPGVQAVLRARRGEAREPPE